MHPPKKRGQTKLFVVYTQTGEIEITTYDNLDQYLNESDVLVRNITKVFHARLEGVPVLKDGSRLAATEVFITEPHAQTLEEYAKRQYDTVNKGYKLQFLSPLKRNKVEQVEYIDLEDGFRMISVTLTDGALNGTLINVNTTITAEKLFTLLASKGKVPLPPYIKRDTDKEDEVRYQTIFARNNGSVAAPTASLNFTKELETRLLAQGTSIAEVTLHVGRGTFLPLRNEVIEENVLHHEPFFIDKSQLALLHNAVTNSQRIVAMGTTVVRTIETVASQIMSTEQQDILSETNLFIYPPYNFRIIQGLLTNFHFPKSSLITLVDAFLQYKKCTKTWREIYQFAMDNDAKLFSYGDSMLIL
jgi:S-adenosylmethionine:tRNA ribosyltransferase-isomerase